MHLAESTINENKVFKNAKCTIFKSLLEIEKYKVMKKIIVLLIFTFLTIGIQAQSFIGVWERYHTSENGEKLKSIVIFSDGYQVITTYVSKTGEFISANGGTWELIGDTMTEKIEFDSNNSERVGTEVSFEVFINDSIMGIVGSEMKFKRIDNGVPRKIQGAWLMSDRIRDGDGIIDLTETTNSSRIETFTFPSNGTTTKGKIFLPASYETNKNLPAIFLIDYTEQHFKLATDEFEKVIDGVQQIQGFDALVVTLENIPDIDAEPEIFKNHYEVYKNMTSYVDANYTNNSSRTFIGKGSESGIVLMALFLESSEKSVFDNFIVTDPSPKYASAIINLIEKDNIPKTRLNKKLHFSFSTSNDRAKCTKLINLIKEAQYPWLKFESIEYTDSDYENTYPISYAAGIKYVFNK